jgi:hypothetical protein
MRQAPREGEHFVIKRSATAPGLYRSVLLNLTAQQRNIKESMRGIWDE